MDDRLDSLAGRTLQSLPADFREHVEASVIPVLNRHRWARRGRYAVFGVVCLTLIVPTARLWLELLPVEMLLVIQDVVCTTNITPVLMPPSLPQIVERTDVFVQARVEEVKPDKRDIIENILHRSRDSVRVTVELDVVKSYPALEAARVSATTAVSVDSIRAVRENRKYLMGLKRLEHEETTSYSFTTWGYYEIVSGKVDPDHVRNLPESRDVVRVERAWEIISSLYDAKQAPDD